MNKEELIKIIEILPIEELNGFKIYYYNEKEKSIYDYGQRGKKQEHFISYGMSILFDAIEALQQENNGWRERYDELDAGHSRLFKDFCKLQQENERLKEQINTAKIGWDTYETYSEQLEQQIAELNKIIETQQQEIEKLKATLADWKYNAKCDADHIAALTTDNDKLVKVLKQARESLQAAWEDDGSTTVVKQILDTINAIDALIGKEKND